MIQGGAEVLRQQQGQVAGGGAGQGAGPRAGQGVMLGAGQNSRQEASVEEPRGTRRIILFFLLNMCLFILTFRYANCIGFSFLSISFVEVTKASA